MDKLEKNIVLILNSSWQVIGVKNAKDAFVCLASGSFTALQMPEMSPVKWEDWIGLPVREEDEFVLMSRERKMRIPTVIISVNYAKVPKRRPRLSNRAIYERDGGTCQYTGRKLRRGEGNVDHILPRDQGGRTSWDNCVLADKKVNTIKANRTPEQAGLKLLKKPKAPAELPVMVNFANPYNIKDWEHFLNHGKGAFESTNG